jgi:hypothetical protein
VTTPAPVEFLYGIDSSVSDDSRFYEPPRVVRFRITKKTPRRIYYEAGYLVRFVDRRRLEADGEVHRKSAGWWERDATVYLQPPVLEQATAPDLGVLKAAMAAAHPDRGGTHEAFIAARRRYEQAVNREAS